MPETVVQPRFHYDRDRSVAPPTLAEMNDWAVSVLVGPHGADARECIRAAGAMRARHVDDQVAVRDVALLAAAALKSAAREVHDIAREFGFDPTAHPDMEDSTGSLVLVRISADFADEGSALRAGLVTIADELARTLHLTAEAGALKELVHGMVRRGRPDASIIQMLKDDAQTETLEMLPALWNALGGRPGDLDARPAR